MSGIEDRIHRLEARFAIQDVMHRYAECVDLARFTELGALFRHGSIHAEGEDPIRGMESVRRFYAATNKIHADGTLRTRHLSSNPIIEVDTSGSKATARSYFVVLQATDELPLQPIVAGRYHDRFHVVEDTWCFAERVVLVDQIGEMSDHLSFDLGRDPIPHVAE